MSIVTGVYLVQNLYNDFILWLQDGVVGAPLVVAAAGTATGAANVLWNVIRHENGSYVIQHNATGLYASSLYDVFGQAVVAAPAEQFFALRQVGIGQNILNIGTSSGDIYWNEQDTLAGAPYTVVVSGFDNSTESLDTNPHRQWNFTRIADLD